MIASFCHKKRGGQAGLRLGRQRDSLQKFSLGGDRKRPIERRSPQERG